MKNFLQKIKKIVIGDNVRLPTFIDSLTLRIILFIRLSKKNFFY